MIDENESDLAQRRTDWAEDRTDWAEDRTVLANERTFAGWMRTGMASVAIAIGLQAVFGETEPTWLAKAAASIFLLIATYIFIVARGSARQMLDRLNSHSAEPLSDRHLSQVALFFMVATIATGVVLWLI